MVCSKKITPSHRSVVRLCMSLEFVNRLGKCDEEREGRIPNAKQTSVEEEEKEEKNNILMAIIYP